MDKAPTHLDLFSGIGGFALACRWAGFRTIAFCEIDKYCRRVLAKNFGAVAYAAGNGQHRSAVEGSVTTPVSDTTQGQTADGDVERRGGAWIGPPRCYGDIFDFDGTAYRGVDLITGGFPCQPFSVAGKRRGAGDDRAIWPEMCRVIAEARPAWVLGENVPGLIAMELDNVLSDLEGIGYAVRAFVIPACAVDARHRRDRLWIVANANWPGSQGRDGQELRECADERVTRESDSSVCDSAGTGFQNGANISVGRSGELQSESERPTGGFCQWEPEPSIRRVVNGLRGRVDRLKGLGNAIVPQVAFELLREIRKLI